ncbi:hypothetical protein M404DRAFT_378175 [Pisolithus tinctorius Marx 270]|uniref:Uncharacterized protein n=1 Tax=Pisolithus tinctorius Marx 270 TaxID=870435 RepID=A0A0C3JFV5_PISTI|nr:hypothetical protein M404DRAFT_378175 [Pisolithus tinctorius Marx 270]
MGEPGVGTQGQTTAGKYPKVLPVAACLIRARRSHPIQVHPGETLHPHHPLGPTLARLPPDQAHQYHHPHLPHFCSRPPLVQVHHIHTLPFRVILHHLQLEFRHLVIQ